MKEVSQKKLLESKFFYFAPIKGYTERCNRISFFKKERVKLNSQSAALERILLLRGNLFF
ncbi:MAG: hypothetical protein IH845_04315 [Nanoarchaeota archaeon]|nr:hypothetical protein [Nanoarchaeota archaeon]